jgi:hypothetical protein
MKAAFIFALNITLISNVAHADKFYMACQTPAHHDYTVEADDVARTFIAKSIDGGKIGAYRVTAIENTPSRLFIVGFTNDGGPPFKAKFRPKRQIEFGNGKDAQVGSCR